jgi:hypothetical protein
VLGLLEAEGDALLLLVDIEDHELELLADLEHLARVTEATPGDVGDVSRPSMPSRSMNAPKSVRFLTVPVTLSPIFVASMKRARFSARSCSMSSRRLRTTFFRSSLILTILKS